MREWDRATSGCRWEALPDEPLSRYAELHRIDDLAMNLLACVETRSMPLRRRLWPRSRASRTVIALTTEYLVWVSEAGGEQVVSAARLSDIEVREYRSTLIEDSGIEVVGFRVGSTERESWFLPLDQGADAQDFRDKLQRAVRAER